MKFAIAVLLSAWTWTAFAAEAPTKPEYTYSLGGFMIYDYLNYFPDRKHVEMTPGSSGRALRFDLTGTLWTKWSFRLQPDFFGDAVRVRHGWLQYAFNERSNLRVGQQPLNYGIESVTSIRDQLLMERAMFHRAWGIRFQKAVTWNLRSDHSVAQLGLYGEDESRDGNPNTTFAYNLRAVWQPVAEPGKVAHLGVVANRTSFRNAAEARFRVNPSGASVIGTNQPVLVDTGVIADRDHLFKGGPELVLAYENFGFMAEYNELRLSRTRGTDARFTGYYANFLWVITGERFPYSPKQAILEAVKPSGPNGAWGLSLRYDHLDLNDKDIAGGEETDMSAALSWWPNANLRFMAQYTASQTTKGAVSDDPRLLQLRAQVMF